MINKCLCVLLFFPLTNRPAVILFCALFRFLDSIGFVRSLVPWLLFDHIRFISPIPSRSQPMKREQVCALCVSFLLFLEMCINKYIPNEKDSRKHTNCTKATFWPRFPLQFQNYLSVRIGLSLFHRLACFFSFLAKPDWLSLFLSSSSPPLLPSSLVLRAQTHSWTSLPPRSALTKLTTATTTNQTTLSIGYVRLEWVILKHLRSFITLVVGLRANINGNRIHIASLRLCWRLSYIWDNLFAPVIKKNVRI